MSTDVAISDLPSVSVADVTGDLHLVARTPAAMQTARLSLVEWLKAKIEITQRDANELAECVVTAELSGMKSGPLKRQAAIAQKRVEFYDKLRIAAENGYCVVPNFPVDLIAVRVNRDYPAGGYTSSLNEAQQLPPPTLSAGEGRYVDPIAVTVERRVDNDWLDKDGTRGTHREWMPQAYDEEIEFPVSIAKPEVMNATVEAMALNVFDSIGVLGVPASRGKGRAKGDPIVVGRIHDPRGQRWSEKFVTFIIAWYLDTRTL